MVDCTLNKISDFQNDYSALQQNGIHFLLIGGELFYHHIHNQFLTNAWGEELGTHMIHILVMRVNFFVYGNV